VVIDLLFLWVKSLDCVHIPCDLPRNAHAVVRPSRPPRYAAPRYQLSVDGRFSLVNANIPTPAKGADYDAKSLW
jgi:hypothetical protein